MSINGANVEDAEMADCDGEKVVTMMDVLKEQQEFEEDANAVLGASDDKNCTYTKGYIKRQAVYACLTCCSDAKQDPDKRAGVCLACSLTCHENHDLVELYTKRNFRCDCGNPKFNNPCQYTENKTSLNDDNIYNQNFSGLYCICHRPYPDPEGVEEEMIQCIVCEDWLHSSHLEATVPSPDLYAEMICKTCMDKNEFLHDYSKFAVNGDVDVVATSEPDDSKHNGVTHEMNGVDVNIETTDIEKVDDCDRLTNTDAGMNTSHVNIDDNEQKQPNLPLTKESEDEDPSNEKNVDRNPTDAVKSSDEIIDNNLVENVASDKVDEINFTEETEAKGIASDKVDDTNSNEGTEALISKDIDKVDASNSTEENQDKDIAIDKIENVIVEENEPKQTAEVKPADENSNCKLNDNDSVANSLEQENSVANNDEDVGIAVVNITDKNQHEVSSQIPQESNYEGEVNGYQQPEDKAHIASSEMQEDTISNLNNTDKTVVKTLDVIENHFGDEKNKENKRKLSTEECTLDVSAKKPKISESNCHRPRNERKMFKGATFWPSQFRQKLCTCNECITMYKDLSVLFLIDPEDTVTAYEVLGKEKTDGAASTQYEKGLEALSSLGRVQQINALTEYNKMRDKLLDFLKSFKDRKEVVKEEDIKAFFAGMKPKREPDGVYFCR